MVRLNDVGRLPRMIFAMVVVFQEEKKDLQELPAGERPAPPTQRRLATRNYEA
jgi:hypothetical protein